MESVVLGKNTAVKGLETAPAATMTRVAAIGFAASNLTLTAA